MRYQGSKKRMVKILKALIEKNLSLGDFYFEPFAGGMNVMSEIDWKFKIANDINPYVIALWKDIPLCKQYAEKPRRRNSARQPNHQNNDKVRCTP